MNLDEDSNRIWLCMLNFLADIDPSRVFTTYQHLLAVYTKSQISESFHFRMCIHS